MHLAIPPSWPRSNHVDVIHGIVVPDPFRTLENDGDPEVGAWAEAQRLRTRGFLDSLPLRAQTESFLRSIWSCPRYGLPVRRKNCSFFWYYDGTSPQGVICVECEGQARILLDPNMWSTDGSASIGDFWPSRDGAFIAYTVHRAGSDWSSIHVVDVQSGEALPDVILNCRWGGVVWLAGSRAFLYSAPPSEDPNREVVRVHTLGSPAELNPTVFVSPQHAPSFIWSVEFSNGQGSACYASSGASSERGCWIVENNGNVFRPLVPIGIAKFEACHRDGDVIYAITTHNAPFGRLVAVSLDNPAPENWRVVVSEGRGALSQAVFVSNRWILRYTEHGWDHIEICSFSGEKIHTIAMPDLGFVFLEQANPDADNLLVSHRSLKQPPCDYRLEPLSGALILSRKSTIKAEIPDCVLSQVFVDARDGAQIPLTLFHRSDLVKNGITPTILYSYGGYGMLSEHSFTHAAYCWVNAGGVYAIAGIRGGGEEGEDWHKAAIGANRQISFNDFIDCSEWLISNKYCSSKTLGIKGGSNGGLLVAACMLQRPELFGGVLCDVPTLDMLRFHLFTVGAGWIPEYGSPDEPIDFSHLLSYSPVHNVVRDVAYPPIMISTADHDDRSVPMHSFKFAAALQETLSPIVLLRLERDAGHGAGISTEKMLGFTADQHAFLWTVLTEGCCSPGLSFG
ncbi:MAG: prolyl oligopeptidase family serine peptidase [Flammeovirgaceae bacterium]